MLIICYYLIIALLLFFFCYCFYLLLLYCFYYIILLYAFIITLLYFYLFIIVFIIIIIIALCLFVFSFVWNDAKKRRFSRVLDKRRTYKKTNKLRKRAENVPSGVFSRVWHEKEGGGGDNTPSAKYMVSIVFFSSRKKSKFF